MLIIYNKLVPAKGFLLSLIDPATARDRAQYIYSFSSNYRSLEGMVYGAPMLNTLDYPLLSDLSLSYLLLV